MFFDTITIDPVKIDWTFVIVIAIITAVLLVLAVTFWLIGQYRNRKLDDNRGYRSALSISKKFSNWFLGAGIVLFLSGAFVTFVAIPAQLGTNQGVSLEEMLGYTNIQIHASSEADTTFIAKDADGLYVSGRLVEIEPNTFIVMLDE